MIPFLLLLLAALVVGYALDDIVVRVLHLRADHRYVLLQAARRIS